MQSNKESGVEDFLFCLCACYMYMFWYVYLDEVSNTWLFQPPAARLMSDEMPCGLQGLNIAPPQACNHAYMQ